MDRGQTPSLWQSVPWAWACLRRLPFLPLALLAALFPLTAAAEAMHDIQLANPALANTDQKRQELKYLATCALPPTMRLVSTQGTERFTFPGSLGLAPQWISGRLSLQQERWVSACLYALTNAYGKHVEVSIRATSPLVPFVPFLRATAEEEQRFPIFEGAFFGNRFASPPVAYACVGPRTKLYQAAPVWKDRVCTISSGRLTPDGRPLTLCNFILTGPCSDPASFTVAGVHYDEVLSAYLQIAPAQP